MKELLLTIPLFLLSYVGFTQADIQEQLKNLNENIEKSAQYDAKKLKAIGAVRQQLHHPISLNDEFNIYLQLYHEYHVYKYDSAYYYAKKLYETARRLNDSSRITYAKMQLGFTSLSSGMFTEAYDILSDINATVLPDSLRAEYYSIMGRYYYDMADYANDSYHSPAYNIWGNKYIDSSLALYPAGSFSYLYFEGLKNIRSGNKPAALQNFKNIIDRKNLTPHQLALTASTLSDIYIQNGQTDTAISLLIKAAIADIQSSTKETSAMFNLASLLFKRGDLKNASNYIEEAINDASFYGARQRKVQLSTILPLIEGEKLNRVETQQKNLLIYASIVTLLLLAVIILAIIIFKQVNKLKTAKRIITEAHAKQQEINNKLAEANKIKEEYIGYFFGGNTEFYSKIERFKKSVEQKIQERKLEEIKFLVNSINLKKEKEELLKNFDKIFLKLFPNFIAEFNALFGEEDRIIYKDNDLLNTDLRIFALIRMGIHDNEKIAQILEYSVNTINTYKTRIKNRSLVPNDEFELNIMSIKTV